jgi:hypothetical protein
VGETHTASIANTALAIQYRWQYANLTFRLKMITGMNQTLIAYAMTTPSIHADDGSAVSENLLAKVSTASGDSRWPSARP